MWNVFVVNGGECVKINQEPYDAEQIAFLLDDLSDDAEPLLLLPAAGELESGQCPG